jgi:hypothetical protein
MEDDGKAYFFSYLWFLRCEDLLFYGSNISKEVVVKNVI